MDSNANARMKESLMRYQPLGHQPEVPPNTSMLCSKCKHTLHRAEDMFQTMVQEAVNDYTTVYTLSIDIKHGTPERNEYWHVQFPGKDVWQHTLRVFNHDRTDYTANYSINVVFKKEPHTEDCPYAYISTYIIRRKQAPIVNQHIARETVKQLTLEARRFTGPGNTSIERKENAHFIEYYVNTMVGSNILLAITPGFERIRGWCHNYQEEEPIDEPKTIKPNYHNKSNYETVISAPQPIYSIPNRTLITDELEELSLNTPKRKLQVRRGTQ